MWGSLWIMGTDIVVREVMPWYSWRYIILIFFYIYKGKCINVGNMFIDSVNIVNNTSWCLYFSSKTKNLIDLKTILRRENYIFNAISTKPLRYRHRYIILFLNNSSHRIYQIQWPRLWFIHAVNRGTTNQIVLFWRYWLV